MGLFGQHVIKWHDYTMTLSESGLFYHYDSDHITWGRKMHNQMPIVTETYIFYVT